MSKRRFIVGPKILTFLLLTGLGGAWFGVFFALSMSNALSPPSEESEVTKNVRTHFTNLAAVQRKALDVDQYYGGNHVPGMLDAIVEFTEASPLPPKTIDLDGFVPKHIDISQGEDGINKVLAVFTRRPPYDWPRSVDINLGADYYERADLVGDLTSKEFASYRVNNDLQLKMKSPNGQYTWELSKDKELMTSPRCLYRQDLYKDGEWIKSLLAIAK